MSTIYSKFYTNFLKFKALIKNDNFFYISEQLEKEQWFPKARIEELQVERLQKILDHAYNESKFYRQKYDDARVKPEDIKTLEDLQKLPLLTREDLQIHSKAMLCPPPNVSVYSDSSGGSTGNPVNFYHDNVYRSFAGAFELLFLSWHNISRGDKTAIFWGADRDFPELSIKEKMMIKMERVKLLNSFNVDERSLDEFLAEVERFNPRYIYGYASSLELAARFINRTGKYVIRPKAIRSSAEMLYDFQREEIEKAFGCAVSNFYGSREVNNLAAECPQHEGLHIFSSGRIVEVVDEDGRQLPAGENGYLAVTDLTNMSFPFIRYRIGDMGIRRDVTCSCGRGYPLLANLTGRSSDIITIGGKYIHGEYFTHLFYGRPEVRQFQVVQESDKKLVVKIVAEDKNMDTSEIEQKIREKIGGDAFLEMEFVDNIPPLKSGKYRFTVNETRQEPKV